MRSISVVVPAHNEEELLEKNMRILDAFLASAGLDYEIIVCENGSTDRTLAIAGLLAKSLPRLTSVCLPKPSFGEALRRGFQEAEKESVMGYPADLAHDRSFILQALPLLEAHEVIYASREMGNMDRPILRRLLTAVNPWVVRRLFGTPFSDIGSLKLFRANTGKRVYALTKSLSSFIEVEVAVILHKLRIPYRELPVIHHEMRTSRFSLPRTIWGHITEACAEFRYLHSLSPRQGPPPDHRLS